MQEFFLRLYLHGVFIPGIGAKIIYFCFQGTYNFPKSDKFLYTLSSGLDEEVNFEEWVFIKYQPLLLHCLTKTKSGT